jgi:tripartite-type tricarboxylate transporter receptor subunit TctC
MNVISNFQTSPIGSRMQSKTQASTGAFKRLERVCAGLLSAFLIAAPGLLAAQSATQSADASAYPSKPLRFMVGFPPGQASDNIARIFSERLAAQLGQPVIVENRPGQGGSLAAAVVKRAAPDGYTFGLMATAALVTNPHLYKSVGYDSLKDFQTVALLAQGPLYLVTHASSPFSSVSELVAYAKANPGKLNYCSSGNGTLSHLAMELLKKRAGISMVHIAYLGSAKGMNDLGSGNVDVCFETGTAIQPYVTTKRAKVLAMSALQRSPNYPDVPTLLESGYPGFEVGPYVGIVFPAGTPKAIVDRMNTELVRIGQAPEVRAQISAVGSSVNISTPQAFAAQVKSDNEKWRALINYLNLKIE